MLTTASAIPLANPGEVNMLLRYSELYAQAFYDQLARVLRRGGRLFHYTGSPNKLTSGRDVPREVAKRLEKSGFKARLALDGVLAMRR